MRCVNHGRINQWVRGAKWQEEHYDTMQVWEGRVNPEDQYLVHSLSVKIKDQGWGNIGVNIAFCAVVGGYLMEIASRALEEGERKMDSLWLVKDGFNFSRFMFNTFLPKGTTSVVLIAMGRLHNAGHEFHYGGHELTLAKIKQTSAEAIAH